MDRRALITSFRVMSGDRGVPPLWADDTVTAFLNQGERRAAVAARLLHDRTTAAVTRLPLVVGQREYRLHRSVFDLSTVGLIRPDSPTLTRPLCQMSETELQATDARTQQTGWAGRFYFDGEPDGSDARGASLVLDRAPDTAGGVLALGVYRRPLFDLEDDGDEPEIAAHHHEHLVDWALFRAYSTRDIEGSASARAQAHKALFTDYFGELPDANVQRKQRRHAAPVVRPLRW